MTRAYSLNSKLRLNGERYQPGETVEVDDDDHDAIASLDRMAARGDAEWVGGEVKTKESKPSKQGGAGGGTQSASSSTDPGSAVTVSREDVIKTAMREAKPADFTNSGKPKTEVLTPVLAKVLGDDFKLTAAERDKLWTEVEAEKSGD